METLLRPGVRGVWAAALLVSLPALAQSAIYRWVDREGVTHYSDTPVGAPRGTAVRTVDDPPVTVIHNDLPASGPGPSASPQTTTDDPWRLPPDPPPPPEDDVPDPGGYGVPLWGARRVRMSPPHFAFQNQSTGTNGGGAQRVRPSGAGTSSTASGSRTSHPGSGARSSGGSGSAPTNSGGHPSSGGSRGGGPRGP